MKTLFQNQLYTPEALSILKEISDLLYPIAEKLMLGNYNVRELQIVVNDAVTEVVINCVLKQDY